ncbi:MAG: hypothetical protein ABF723_04000 [Lentilactobacillus hilgardii]|uniref:hypothetical protein n=1 Tax=Lentilactobacillus hilgardii TaxID=1588 RepID=UPI001CC1E443|nr:hypothetical protein [Lentilactobacillus hilgardii]MBZ2200055.1 hypothetical protein [Lentilactobacillus hilgardii]MBZ2203175.1 hypothetical protein [Lentilactobacillus hilgardii]
MIDLDELSYQVEHTKTLLAILVDLTQWLDGTAVSYREDKSHQSELVYEAQRQAPMINELAYQIFINEQQILKEVTALTQKHYQGGGVK